MQNNDLGAIIVSTAIYIKSKLDGNTYCKTNGQFSRHLKANDLNYRDYIETYITGFTPLCSCFKPLSFYQKSESYANSCGSPICVGKTISKIKQAWTEEEKQVDSSNKKEAAKLRNSETEAIRIQKSQQTFFKKYRVLWGSQLDTQKQKSRKTKLEKYGSERWNNSAAISSSNLSKLPEEKDKINNRRRATNLKKYGVENTLLFANNNSKSNKGNASIKDYILPSGKVIGVRGHEPYALNELFRLSYKESEIIVHDDYSPYAIEIFEFEATNRHSRKYYPDIYIPHENRIIEVKSQWWWNGNGIVTYASRLENNLRKRRSVLAKGYNYEVWIFESKTQYKILNHDSDF